MVKKLNQRFRAVVVEFRPSIQLEERTLALLKEVAQRRQTSLDEIVRESIEEFVEREARALKIDAIVDRLMVEHAWLLDELAKR